MAHNQEHGWTLRDETGSHSWIVENLDVVDYVGSTEAEINSWLDELEEFSKSYAETTIREWAQGKDYPCYGFTTADKLKDEDEYIAYHLEQMHKDHKADRASAVAFIKAWIADGKLNEVMTASEVAEEFGLSESAVRVAINRETLKARKSGGTWLVLREDAEAKWGDDYLAVEEVKAMIQGQDFIVRDVSGYNSRGYNFALFKAETITEPVHHQIAIGEPLAETVTVSFPDSVNKIGSKGAYDARFKGSEVRAVLAKGNRR